MNVNMFARALSTSICFGVAGLTTTGTASALSDDTPLTAEQHAVLGLEAAAGFPGYASLCNLEMRFRDVNRPREARSSQQRSGANRPAGQTQGNRPQRTPLKPMQVFDNLYFVGTRGVSAWLYGTDEGYILIDALNTDEQAQRYIFEGMQTLGLDPANIQYMLVTHGHGDHYGGADYVAEKLGLDVMMSGPDWDLVSRLGTHPRFGPPPERGLTAVDGQTLRAGTSEMVLHLSPGHTPGTISPIFKVYDNGEEHTAVLWGGTGFNFGANKAIFELYANSARKMRAASETADVDVILSNHPRRDESDLMMAKLDERAEGAPHPFVKGQAGHALFSVLEHCALAQAQRVSAASE